MGGAPSGAWGIGDSAGAPGFLPDVKISGPDNGQGSCELDSSAGGRSRQVVIYKSRTCSS